MRGFKLTAEACVRGSSVQPPSGLTAVWLLLLTYPGFVTNIRSGPHNHSLNIIVIATLPGPRLRRPVFSVPSQSHYR